MTKHVAASVSLAVVCCALLISCGVPRIDGSSALRANVSLARVRGSVPNGQRERFDADLAFLLSDGGRATPLLTDERARSRIDGKTADDVMRTADELRKQIAQSAHEAEVQRQLAEIRGTLGRMDASDVNATLSARSTPAGEAGSLKRLVTDAEVIAFCARVTHDAAGQKNCEASEMKAKEELQTVVTTGFPADMVNRMHIACDQQANGSFRGRLECMQGLVRAVPAVLKNPKLLDDYPEENRKRMEWIAGM